jgi:hypothetical protein
MTFNPAKPSSAGRSVTASTTASVTAVAAATPMEPMNGTPVRNSPTIATTTTMPAKTTALPAVATARAALSRTSPSNLRRFSWWRAMMNRA